MTRREDLENKLIEVVNREIDRKLSTYKQRLLGDIACLNGLLFELADTCTRFWFYDRDEIKELFSISDGHPWMKRIQELQPCIIKPSGRCLWHRDKILSIVEQYNPEVAEKIRSTLPKDKERLWNTKLQNALKNVKHKS